MLSPEDLEQIRDIVGRGVEAMAVDLSGLRAELISRLDAADRRAELTVETIRSLDIRVAGILRWTNHAEGDAIALDNKHREQERKLRDLATRVEALERGQRPH